MAVTWSRPWPAAATATLRTCPTARSIRARSFAGAFVIKEVAFEAYARNITPDMETGIGSWSEDDIVNAIRNGQQPDGKYYGPPMSFGWYSGMSDTDAHAIAAYLKTGEADPQRGAAKHATSSH